MGKTPHKILRLSDLAQRTDTIFTIEPDATERADLAAVLGLEGIKKLRFDGKLKPVGRTDWQLDGALGATVVQECVVTLAPVTTRIDEKIARSYVQNFEEPLIGEVEMPEDDTVEPLPATLDLFEVMTEALSLALPPFPRAEGAELGEAVYTEPGVAPMKDEDARPFAGLAGLKAALEKKDESGD